MNRLITTIAVVFATLCCSEAYAVKQLVHIAPNATTFRVETQDDQTVRFTIVHDPKDVRNPSDNPLSPTRTAQLKISTGSRLLLTAPIASRVNQDGKLVYEFRVSEAHARHASLVVSENPSGVIGDGTIYKYSATGVPEELRDVLQGLFDGRKDRQESHSDN